MAEKYEHLEKLRKERDAKKLKFEQTKHQITRKENQIKKMKNEARTARTHLLCTKAGKKATKNRLNNSYNVWHTVAIERRSF